MGGQDKFFLKKYKKLVTKSDLRRLIHVKRKEVSTLDIEKLYQTYYMQVYSYAMTVAKDPHVAEEVTQETFAKAMASTYKGTASEYTWLCAIAKNVANDHFRAQKRVAPLDEVQEETSAPPEADVIARASSLEIHRILHHMEEPYKEVFELRVFGELAFRDIADIFGKTESWARVTYHRARLKIKERMTDDDR